MVTNKAEFLLSDLSPKSSLRKISSLVVRFLFLAGNTRAINEDRRFIDFDLNRHWTEDNVKRNRPGSTITTSHVEDKEQTELLVHIDDLLNRARNEVYAIDLHSTSSESEPFAMIGDTLRNRSFAENFPVTLLLGIEEQIEGTVMEYLGGRGAVTIGYEAGQHGRGIALRNQEAFIWGALVSAGIIDESDCGENWHETLSGTDGIHSVVEVRHRHGLTPDDEFRMHLGYENFQPIKKGEELAVDKSGAIRAIESGLILLPLYQSQGNDGFFIGRRISRFWLHVSRVLRLLRLGTLIGWLPGVTQLEDSVLSVNTRIARVLPLQLFHLLGFRKRRWSNDRLVVTKRRHDLVSPFKST